MAPAAERSVVYEGRYLRTAAGRERAQVSCTTQRADGGSSHVVLASGPRALLDWDTTPDWATVAAVILHHWLGAPPSQDDLQTFLNQIATDWQPGHPWTVADQQLQAAGLTPLPANP
ncbi:hypothetical protein GKE82_25985 [Conexibacter sp. W3-3-2]|uniref:hypothetical protein n=1 Tax=Conexibacter sp. W3-3-2 TaxID=2675227 RepID=UPI0012B70003|nr:hypothetical protein [Conexibacter sp. W3-3-2]MTD47655.1 hypothetical protein [Conexibacter sp. W3-3-2]